MDRAFKTKRDQLGDVDQPNNDVTIGVDLGDRKSHLCVLDNHGEIVNEEAITTSPAALERLFPEASTRSCCNRGWHAFAVGKPGYSRLRNSAIVANAVKVKLIFSNDGKNDKVDARSLARLAEPIPGCYFRYNAGARERNLLYRLSGHGTCWFAPELG